VTPAGWGAASAYDDVAGEVAIVGVGESDHSKASGRSSVEIALQATERALDDAGLSPHDVDGIMYSASVAGQLTEADFRRHFGVRGNLWVSHEGGAMHWAATAPYAAAQAIRQRQASVILNTFAVAWATERSQMVGGPGESHAADRAKQNFEVPFGWFPQPVYMATIARRHMHDYGTRVEHLGRIAVTCRQHANLHPTAVMGDRPLTIDDYLASPVIVDPFRKEDCCLISDGGGAYVMASRADAAGLRQPVVEVGGVGRARSFTGLHYAQQDPIASLPLVFAGPVAMTMAGITNADVDVVECYDPFTFTTLISLEDLGFCPKGEGGPFLESTSLRYDGGGLPAQTHGGLLSHAYVHGIAHVVELVRQLRHQAAAQVPEAEVGIYAGVTGAEAGVLVLRRAR
jgi:acetyl-CoA acetyltransferase